MADVTGFLDVSSLQIGAKVSIFVVHGGHPVRPTRGETIMFQFAGGMPGPTGKITNVTEDKRLLVAVGDVNYTLQPSDQSPNEGSHFCYQIIEN